MFDYAADWLNLLLRWGHIIVAIGWIGTSFYFMALDYGLRRREKMNTGVMGTAWLVHGGGFYHVEKYTVAPDQMPPDLKWYQWDAYLTFVSGMALMVVHYYFNASAFMIDPGVADLTATQAILISVLSLAAGWFIYDAMCKSDTIGGDTTRLAIGVFVLIMVAAFGYTQVFSGRAAFLHVGAFIGTLMAVNVFGVIVPNQKKIVASLLAKETPDGRLGKMGKQRSTHNNYLTLPVILFMVSNHYPMLTGHAQPLLIIFLILVMGASVRHFINRHDAHDKIERFVWTVPVTAVALLAAVVVSAPKVDEAMASLQVADAEAMSIVEQHCSTCHAANPSHPAFSESPAGMHLETVADLRRYSDQIWDQTVASNAMPLGNETGMTEEDRRRLGAWLQTADSGS